MLRLTWRKASKMFDCYFKISKTTKSKRFLSLRQGGIPFSILVMLKMNSNSMLRGFTFGRFLFYKQKFILKVPVIFENENFAAHAAKFADFLELNALKSAAMCPISKITKKCKITPP